jgi:N-acetylglucosaminyldiphosphoundecaprenol N-acetyl-beta-D-mannosaminyltransferase
MDELLDICEEHIKNRKSTLLGTINAAKLVNCRRDAELNESLKEADIVLADGLPVVWLTKLIGNPLPERVAGIDIMYQLLERSSEKHYRVFFLGGEKSVVQNVVHIAEKKYPGLIIAGYRDGYFKESESANVAEEIRRSSADIIFVAMSSPKKENFLRKWRNFINVPICHGVGGSFDVLAGVTRRAPLWMQKCGMEWFYRLVQEPKRMWKRYLVTNTVFIKLSIEAIIQARLSKLLNKSRLTRVSNIKEND